MTIVDEIIDLLNTKAEGRYGLSNVNQRQHALQCAMLAERSGEPATMIVAALVHDIGHMLHDLGEDFVDVGIDDRHEQVGLIFLSKAFGPEVTAPVALHVDAKRYLCAAEPDYFQKLSDDSVKTLKLQGGPMNEEEMQTFRENQYWKEALRLRRYDDQGKSPFSVTPEPEHFRSSLEACLQTA